MRTLSPARIAEIRNAVHPVTGAPRDYDPLIDRIGNSSFVLIGEASHGTHEFYQQRAEITKRLITEKGFTAVAVEADWPDAYRVNRFVRGYSGDAEIGRSPDATRPSCMSLFQSLPLRELRPLDPPAAGLNGADAIVIPTPVHACCRRRISGWRGWSLAHLFLQHVV